MYEIQKRELKKIEMQKGGKMKKLLSLTNIFMLINKKNSHESKSEDIVTIMSECGPILAKDESVLAGFVANEDKENIQEQAKIFKEHSKVYLDRLNSLQVPTKMANILYEYKLYLENCYFAGKYIEEGIGTNNGLLTDIGFEYKQKANENLITFDHILEKIPRIDCTQDVTVTREGIIMESNPGIIA